MCIAKNCPVIVNDPELTNAMLPTLPRVAGDGLRLVPTVAGSEDFSFFQRVVPRMFVFIGVTAPGNDPKLAAPNHSPRFHGDESVLWLGVRTLAYLACG